MVDDGFQWVQASDSVVDDGFKPLIDDSVVDDGFKPLIDVFKDLIVW